MEVAGDEGLDFVLTGRVEVLQCRFDRLTEPVESFVILPVERPLFNVLPQAFDQIQIRRARRQELFRIEYGTT